MKQGVGDRDPAAHLAGRWVHDAVLLGEESRTRARARVCLFGAGLARVAHALGDAVQGRAQSGIEQLELRVVFGELPLLLE